MQFWIYNQLQCLKIFMRVKDVSIICKKMNKEKKWWMIKNRAMNKKQKEIYFPFIKCIKAFESKKKLIDYNIQNSTIKTRLFGVVGEGFVFWKTFFNVYKGNVCTLASSKCMRHRARFWRPYHQWLYSMNFNTTLWEQGGGVWGFSQYRKSMVR